MDGAGRRQWGPSIGESIVLFGREDIVPSNNKNGVSDRTYFKLTPAHHHIRLLCNLSRLDIKFDTALKYVMVSCKQSRRNVATTKRV